MIKFLFFLLLGCLSALTSCQQKPSVVQSPPKEAAESPLLSEAQAREAVARYVREQPNSALFQVDSAQITDSGDQWQVLVPRTDWVGRMPNRAAFEVHKRTGEVSTRPVK